MRCFENQSTRETVSNIKWRYLGNQGLKYLFLAEILDAVAQVFTIISII